MPEHDDFDFDLDWTPGHAPGLDAYDLGDETCVYAPAADEIHRLGPAAADLWRRCDGATTAGELAAALGAGQGGPCELAVVDVVDGLQDLLDRGLLGAPPQRAGGLGRRALLTRVGAGAAAGVGLFLVESLAAPLPVQAASCLQSGDPCTVSAQCCSGLCVAGTCA